MVADPWKDPWRGEAVGRWLALEETMDGILEPFGRAALARAEARAGERALDVGCGCGATTIALAEAVGRGGQVMGIDIAGALLARARERAAAWPQAAFLEADAETAALPADRDLLFSRFGVMFFQDSAGAFANLARALRSGGRLAFVCWRGFAENPWLRVPFEALREVLPETALPPGEAPGPFALADSDRLHALLASAGFRDVALERFDQPVRLGADLPAAVTLAMSSGPAGRALPGVDEATRRRVRERITAALERTGATLPAAAWVVSGRVV